MQLCTVVERRQGEAGSALLRDTDTWNGHWKEREKKYKMNFCTFSSLSDDQHRFGISFRSRQAALAAPGAECTLAAGERSSQSTVAAEY